MHTFQVDEDVDEGYAVDVSEAADGGAEEAAYLNSMQAVEETPPPTDRGSDTRGILLTAGLGIVSLAAIAGVLVLGKKLYSSQAPKIQKVSSG